jgi:hypothetical protein
MTWTDKQLRAHKKASAGLSVATSTMGIAALGAVGARAGAGRAVKVAQRAGRLKHVTPDQVKAFRGKSTGISAGLTTGSAGLGGVGGYNYAAIQNAESKRSVKKMDDGLGIWKAMTPEQRKINRSNAKITQEHTQKHVMRGLGAGLAGGAAGAAIAVNPRAVKSIARSAQYGVKAGKHFYAASKPAPGVARIGNPGLRTRAADAASSARVQRSRLRSATIGGAHMARATREHTRGGTVFNRSGYNPYTSTAAVVGGMWGGTAGANAGEKYGRRQAKKDPRYQHSGGVTKNMSDLDMGLGWVLQGPEEIEKAYSPERKRMRRLDTYQTGANIGAGALGAGAVGAGIGTHRKVLRAVKRTPGGKNTYLKLTGLGAKGGAGRGAAVTAALGIGAVGAAVGADRIQRYKRGNGRSYKPLHGQI